VKRALASSARAATCIVVGLVLVAACWRSSPPQPAEPPPAEPARQPHPRPAPPRELTVLEQFDQFADDMCKCHDWNCAQQVAEDMTRWSQDSAKEGDKPELSPDDQQRAAEIGTRIGQCMQSAMSAGTPAQSGSAGPTP